MQSPSREEFATPGDRLLAHALAKLPPAERIEDSVLLATVGDLMSATAVLSRARGRKHKKSIRALRMIAASGRHPGFNRQEIPHLHRDLYELGDLEAGAEFAKVLDRGEYVPRNVGRADKIYAHIFTHHMQSALRGSRSAMLHVASCYASGSGLPHAGSLPEYADLDRCWRIALYWYLRAAGSRKLASLKPVPEDFHPPFDAVALHALEAIGEFLYWGKGIARDSAAADAVLALAARNGSLPSRLNQIKSRMRSGQFWMACGEKKHGRGEIAEAHRGLTELKGQGLGSAHLEDVAWISWVDVRNLPQAEGLCLPDESSVCTAAAGKIDELFSSLAAASGLQVSSDCRVQALRIRIYRLLLFKQLMTELRGEPDYSADELAGRAQELWQQAVEAGYLATPAEEALLEDSRALVDVIELKSALLELMLGAKAEFDKEWAAVAQTTNWFCPQTLSGAWARFIQAQCRSRALAADKVLLDWCGLRHMLARLEHDIHAREWRRALIEAQLASEIVARRLPQAKSSAERAAEAADRAATYAAASVRKVFAKSGTNAATTVAEPDPQGSSVFAQSIEQMRLDHRRREVMRSTQDIGISYNALHPLVGTPLPGIRASDSSRSIPGWQRVDTIVLVDDAFSIEGVEAERGQLPMVIAEDITVLLCCQFLEMSDQRLSLEPLFGFGQSTMLDCQLEMKEWSPEWLSETMLGRSLYYSDRLLVLDDSGRTLLSQFEGTDDALYTAEDTRAWILPEPWRTARQAGGTVTCANGRVMHTPLSMNWGELGGVPQIRGSQTSLPMPRTHSGVVGADIATYHRSGHEDRRVGEGNLRFFRARRASVMTQNYAQMEAAFPVYQRTRQLHAINAGLYSARVEHGVTIGKRLHQRLERERQRFVDARKWRLAQGGLDAVIS